MNVSARPPHQPNLDIRLRARIEKLQRVIEAYGENHEAVDELTAAATPSTYCYPPNSTGSPPPLRRPRSPGTASAGLAAFGDGSRGRPLLPFPGYPNASNSHLVEECLGLNLLGANERTWAGVLHDLQIKLARTRRYTYICITDSPDFSYFIQRGITFEHIGYLDRLTDPEWMKYFRLNIDLIKQKYGLRELILVGDPRYAA